MSKKRKILYIINEAYFFLSHKSELASYVNNLDYEVSVAVPYDHVWAPKNFNVSELIERGYIVHQYKLSRRGQNIFREIFSFLAILKIIYIAKPDILHLMTIKPIIYGGISTYFFKVPNIIFSITGLGQIFTAKGKIATLRKICISIFLKFIFYKKNCKVIVQNSNDYKNLVDKKIISKDKLYTIKGSGINLDKYFFSIEPKNSIPYVIMASRLIWEKGIDDFVEAAKICKKKNINVKFVIVGDTQPSNPRSIPVEELEKWQEDKIIEWWGRREDMVNVISKSTIFCVPSKYGEGVPKVLMEAISIGRAVVVSNCPGCIELIDDSINGYVYPMGNSEALSQKIIELLNEPGLRKKFIKSAYNKISKDYISKDVIAKTVELYEEI